MAAFFKKTFKQLITSPTKSSLRDDKTNPTDFFKKSRIVEGGLFFIFSALVVIISFFGQKPKESQILLNQPAPTRLTAEFPFVFESKILLEKKIETLKNQVPPVFERTFEPYEEFRQVISELENRITRTQIDFEKSGNDTVQIELEKTITSLVEESSLEVDPATIITLTNDLSTKERSQLFNDSLKILWEIYNDGIYAARKNDSKMHQISVIQILNDEESNNLPEARSLKKATVFLRRHLDALALDDDHARSLFEILQTSLKPNLVYSESETRQAINLEVSKIEPQIENYEKGDTLVEPGIIVTELIFERMNAYNTIEISNGTDSDFFNLLFIKRTILTALLLIAVYAYITQGLRDVYKHNQTLAITAVSILLNLLIIRLIMEIGEIVTTAYRPLPNIMLPFIAPYALAPIIVAVLVGQSPAVLSALIVSVIFGIMQNNSVEFMLITFLSGVIGSLTASYIRKRSMLVRAGFFAGGTAALAGSCISFLNNFSAVLIGQQIIIALLIGILTGIVAVGLLPVLEYVFKITTEITLLELTDFNHPLLRRMQMEAPGTYNHSLMVANLSENAADAIGASPLLCRVCCFFHDVGKLVKPEYFAENQQDRINPHNEKNPSMSALVLKAHVKEGVELARKNKLPRVITDVIQQHHGTSLINYFYYQAQQHQKNRTKTPLSEKGDKPLEPVKVDESTYRYDGPKPAFKESAIIFFADGVEAASRSLKKVTQPAVEELIDNIFKDRIEDRQLDDCPLTFQELYQIRKSFIYTLLNMLHSRIQYPKEEADTNKDGVNNEPYPTGNQ